MATLAPRPSTCPGPFTSMYKRMGRCEGLASAKRAGEGRTARWRGVSAGAGCTLVGRPAVRRAAQCAEQSQLGGGGGALAASQLHQQQRYFLLNARHQDGVPLPEQALTSARHSASRMQEERKSKSGICSTWGRGRRGGGGGKGRAGGAAGGSTNDQSCKPARSALVLLPPSKDSDQAPPPSLPLTLNPGRW